MWLWYNKCVAHSHLFYHKLDFFLGLGISDFISISLDAATIHAKNCANKIKPNLELQQSSLCAVVVYEKFCQKCVPSASLEFHILIDKWLNDIKD